MDSFFRISDPTASDPDQPVNPLRPRLQPVQYEIRWLSEEFTFQKHFLTDSFL